MATYFVISDIHSFYNEMIDALNKAGYNTLFALFVDVDIDGMASVFFLNGQMYFGIVFAVPT